ncbi:MAG: FliG C-terminal domain-containing protein [Armatimonadota bacterium]|nr:hypothetical protein [bacterium]
MAIETQELSGLEKASVLMMSLGASTSAKVFEHLSPTERELLGAKIASLRHVDTVVRQRVLNEVNQIVKTGAGSVLNELVQDEPESDEPLKWLEKMDPAEVAGMLFSERPQNIALVVAHLSPHSAAEILTNLSDSQRNDVALRLATIHAVSKEAIEAVDSVMRAKAETHSRINPRGRETLLGLLGGATGRVRESVIGALHRTDQSMASKVKRLLSSPEDLAALPDIDIRAALVGIDPAYIGMALRVGSEELKAAVLRNVSEETVLAIHRELASPAQITVKDVELAQDRIVQAMKQFADDDQTLEADGE